MALFSSSQSETEENNDQADQAEEVQTDSQTKDSGSGKPPKRIDNSRHDVIVRPHITEKATYLTDEGVYTFVVKKDAHKPQIKQAIKDIYGVNPRKIRTANLPKKQVQSRRGKDGEKGGGKKAYVYLREGDSIELM